MKTNKVTISDVARQANVSRSTVSRVLNNQSGVGDVVRQKVLNHIQSMGYTPNTLAKSLIKGHTNIVALIFGDVRNPFYSDLAFFIQKYLNEKGYMVMALNSEYDVQREIEYIKMADQFNFAGLILLTAETPELNSLLEQTKMATVLVNRTFWITTGDSVSLDNFQAGYLAGKHLIDLGHRSIIFVSGPMSSPSSLSRYQGFLQVMHDHGIPFDDKTALSSTNLRIESGYEVGKAFIAHHDSSVTAAVLSNDMAAIGFMEACHDAGLSIPQDLSVVSFDNIVYSGLHFISLTTIDQHPKEMSRIAVDLFLKRMQNPEVENRSILLKPELVIRSSTRSISN